jgi:hypothetical protein
MRKILFGLAGALALGVGALASEPAQAQGFSVTVGSPYGYGPAYGYPPPPPRYAPAYGYGRPGPAYRRYSRHPRRVYYAPPAPRCVIRRERQFDGFGWVSVRRRVCY